MNTPKKINFPRQFCAIFLLISAKLFAQEQPKKFHFAPKIGAAISTNAAGNTYGDVGAKTGMYIGASGIYSPGKFGAELEFQYSSGGHTDNSELDLNSFTVIPSVRYNPNRTIAIKAGPFVSGFTSVKIESDDAKDYFKSGDAGIHIGIEYRIYQNLFIEARYLFGLQDISDIDQSELLELGLYNPIVNGTVDLEYRTRMLQIGLNYQF